jgi:hypothetical protein
LKLSITKYYADEGEQWFACIERHRKEWRGQQHDERDCDGGTMLSGWNDLVFINVYLMKAPQRLARGLMNCSSAAALADMGWLPSASASTA